MGEVPSWYRTLKAAQYLGMDPEALRGKPFRLVLEAEAAQAAEQHAEKVKAQAAKGRQGRMGASNA